MYHRPVLLDESLNGLNVKKGGTYIDFTYGGGGHSAAILKRLGRGKLVAFDQDPDAEKNIRKDKRLLFIRGNFRYVKNYLRFHGINSIHGALADLGVSSHHFDVAERGFSFRHDTRLDMRMNPDARRSAVEVLDQSSENELSGIFARYGEIKNAKKLAAAIVRARTSGPIETTSRLHQAIEACLPRHDRSKYLAKVYQSLRIEVNDEMNALERMLEGVTPYLMTGGRLVIITYHSLEDRMVKHFMRTGNFEGTVRKDFYGSPVSPFRPVNRNVITPSAAELAANPRARSAKLRIAEKQAVNSHEPEVHARA